MKTIAFMLALFSASSAIAGATVTFTVPKAEVLSDDIVLDSISDVETGGNPWIVGRLKERTAYQFRANTWKIYSRVPHGASASHPQEAHRVAKAYLADIRAKLKERGYPETPFFIAVSWNAGTNFANITSTTRDYAQRVANLVEARQAARKEARPAAPQFVIADTTAVTFSIPGARPAISLGISKGNSERFQALISQPLFAMVAN